MSALQSWDARLLSSMKGLSDSGILSIEWIGKVFAIRGGPRGRAAKARQRVFEAFVPPNPGAKLFALCDDSQLVLPIRREAASKLRRANATRC